MQSSCYWKINVSDVSPKKVPACILFIELTKIINFPGLNVTKNANRQGFFCQSKADVKSKQHLVLLKTIYSLASFLLFFLLSKTIHNTFTWSMLCICKRELELNSKPITTVLHFSLKTKKSSTPNLCHTETRRFPFALLTSFALKVKSEPFCQKHRCLNPSNTFWLA